MSEEQDGPIKNYEEFFNEILDDYNGLVAVTRLPEYMFKEADLPDTEFKHGKTCGNILLKNEVTDRPSGGSGMIFAEQWMIFPEAIEPAIIEAINKGSNSKSIVGKFHFSLHKFTEVKISFTFADPEASETFRTSWDKGEIASNIAEKIKETGYDETLCIRYYNSDLTEELKI